VLTDDEGGIEVICQPGEFGSIKAALEKAGLKAEVAEITMRAETPAPLAGEDAQKMQKLLMRSRISTMSSRSTPTQSSTKPAESARVRPPTDHPLTPTP
jgi:hypothetical protein